MMHCALCVSSMHRQCCTTRDVYIEDGNCIVTAVWGCGHEWDIECLTVLILDCFSTSSKGFLATSLLLIVLAALPPCQDLPSKKRGCRRDDGLAPLRRSKAPKKKPSAATAGPAEDFRMCARMRAHVHACMHASMHACCPSSCSSLQHTCRSRAKTTAAIASTHLRILRSREKQLVDT